jgi:DNA-directed RNA polymerase beta subunit
MRSFDSSQQFNTIKAAAVEAAKSIFPIEGRQRVIKLDSVTVEDRLDSTDYPAQAKAKASGGTWGVPVYASLTLYDKATGKVIDRNPKVRLFLLPKITPRFSYIVAGNEYQVHNQLRLKPGAYTIKKRDDGELKTNVNLAQGKNFELMFDEHKNLFSITKVAGGQARLPLFPLLIHLGMSEQAIQHAWGNDLAAANRSTDPKIAERTAQAFGVHNGDIKDYFYSKTKIDPVMTKLTLGEGFDKVSGPMLLAASKKLLEVHLGKSEPNDLN